MSYAYTKNYSEPLNYTVKHGDTPQKVAKEFGVTVKDLLQYNAPVLGGRFQAGVSLRNPKAKDVIANEAVQMGASPKEIAKALGITVSEAISRYFPEPKEDSLEEIKATGKKKDQELFPVKATGERREQDAFPVTATGQRREQDVFPVRATGERKEQELFPITPTGERREQELFPVTPTGTRKEVDDPSMYRRDGSRKSERGFLGPIQTPDGKTMTEFSIGVEIDGQEMEIPSLVPTLTEKEIESLIEGNVTEAIQIKARDHALKRLDEGKSVFYQDGEEQETQGQKVYNVYPSDLLSPEEKQKRQKDQENIKSLYALAGYNVEFDEEQPIYSSTNPEQDYIDAVLADKKMRSEGLKKEIGYALTLDTADEIQALVRSVNNDTSFEQEFEGITKERDAFRNLYPGTSTAISMFGAAVPAGLATTGVRAATSLGLPASGAVVEGLYGVASGRTTGERIALGGIGAGAGYIIAKGVDKLSGLGKKTEGVDPIKVGDDVDYVQADGSTVIARVIGEDDETFTITTQLTKESPEIKIQVNKASQDIEGRIPVNLDDANITPIERVPKGEETPFTILPPRINEKYGLTALSINRAADIPNNKNILNPDTVLSLKGTQSPWFTTDGKFVLSGKDHYSLPEKFVGKNNIDPAYEFAKRTQAVMAKGADEGDRFVVTLDFMPNQTLSQRQLAALQDLATRSEKPIVIKHRQFKGSSSGDYAEASVEDITRLQGRIKKEMGREGSYQPIRYQTISQAYDDSVPGLQQQAPTRTVVPEGGLQIAEPKVVTPSFREAARSPFTETIYGPAKGPFISDATNVGELFTGIKNSFKRTYDRLTPMTDLLQRRVSRQFGARTQRGDETATKENQLDYERFVEPIQPIAEKFDTNVNFRTASLLYSEGSITRNELLDVVKAEFGDKARGNMANHLAWSARKNSEYNFSVTGRELREDYLHRQRILADDKQINKAIEEEFKLPMDAGSKNLKTSIKQQLENGNKDIINQYQNVYFTNTRRIFNNNKIKQIAEKHGVRGGPGATTPEAILQKIRVSAVKRGISPERADFGIQEIRRNLLGERKVMNQYLQAFQTLGYAGSLAGPKSALLNLHDIPQTAVTQGPAAIRSWFKGIVKDQNGKFLADSFGFSQQSKFGEFANSLNQTINQKGGTAKAFNKTANETTNVLMKASLFQLSDKIGKGGVLRSVQQRAVDDAMKGGWQELKKTWGTYFSDPELMRVARELRKHGMNDAKYSKESMPIIEEMMMAGLGQQQLISSGGRPAVWADHPNARIFLALRGFAMKQQALAYRNIVQNIQEGNVQAAKDYAIRYALYSMGAFAVINEFRQFVFGDGNVSKDRILRSFFDQLVGVLSLNSASVSDYSWGKLQRGEFLSYLAANNTPIAIAVPAEAVDDVFDTLTGEKELSELPETLPLFKQLGNLESNIRGD